MLNNAVAITLANAKKVGVVVVVLRRKGRLHVDLGRLLKLVPQLRADGLLGGLIARRDDCPLHQASQAAREPFLRCVPPS